MIKLTLIDNTEILINTNQIDKVLSGENAIIQLKCGEKIIVKETVDSIRNLIKTLAYRDDLC